MDFDDSPCSLGWFKGKITGKSHISWENLRFPVDFPLRQPVDLCHQWLETIGESWKQLVKLVTR